MADGKVQLIDPRDAGLRGVNLKRPVFDEATLARADDVLHALAESLCDWLDADIEKLQQARLEAETARWPDAALDRLMGVAHDLKGMGSTYGYPIVTQMAASLCRCIETPAGKVRARQDAALVCAHVDALRAVVRDRIKNASHPVGRALVGALEQRVQILGVAPR